MVWSSLEGVCILCVLSSLIVVYAGVRVQRSAVPADSADAAR